jgi:hypothetical protein
MDELNKKEEKKIEDNVLAAIHSGQIKMRPRWQFILKAALIATGVVIVLLALIYLVSFILFALHESGAWFVPVFGFSGWIAFFQRLPWVLIGFVVLFIILLQVLVSRYAFSYHRPLLASALCIVGIVLVGGVAISLTRFHNQLFDSARHNGLPVFGAMYRGFGMPRFDDIHRGEINEIMANGFVFQDDDGDTSTVVITPTTRLPLGDGFMASDTVIVFGREDLGGMIRAVGIEKIGNP